MTLQWREALELILDRQTGTDRDRQGKTDREQRPRQRKRQRPI